MMAGGTLAGMWTLSDKGKVGYARNKGNPTSCNVQQRGHVTEASPQGPPLML